MGEREASLDWKLRKDCIHNFLLGNRPRHPQMTKVVQWYKELKSADLLTLGPLDIQYADYQKQQTISAMFAAKKRNTVVVAGAKLKATVKSKF